MGNVGKCSVIPLLTPAHKVKKSQWAKKYLKMDFKKVLWTDESRVTLDGPDGWTSGWLLHEKEIPGPRCTSAGGWWTWLLGLSECQHGLKINSISGQLYPMF